jgi:hypothetical protein
MLHHALVGHSSAGMEKYCKVLTCGGERVAAMMITLAIRRDANTRVGVAFHQNRTGILSALTLVLKDALKPAVLAAADPIYTRERASPDSQG